MQKKLQVAPHRSGSHDHKNELEQNFRKHRTRNLLRAHFRSGPADEEDRARKPCALPHPGSLLAGTWETTVSWINPRTKRHGPPKGSLAVLHQGSLLHDPLESCSWPGFFGFWLWFLVWFLFVCLVFCLFPGPRLTCQVAQDDSLKGLEQQGWALPIAVLACRTFHLPVARHVEANRRMQFSGSNTGLVDNSALRFCLLMQWHSIPVRHKSHGAVATHHPAGQFIPF